MIRQHGATLHIEWVGERRPCGRTETGAVFEQEVRLSDGDGEDDGGAADHGGVGQADP